MATTKAILAQQVIRKLSGGDQSKDSQVDRREVIKIITQIISYKAKIDFFENYKFGEQGIDGQYIATYKNLSPTLDTDRSEYYVTLPGNYVALPNGRGIRQVSPMKNPRKAYIIRTAGNQVIYNNIPAGNLEKNIGVYPEGGKLYFTGDVIKEGFKSGAKVLVKMVSAGPDSIGESDPLPMDAAAEKSVVDEAFAWFTDKLPQDKINNNNERM